MRVVISQPRYLPVISYLQRLRHADVFVFLDDVQRQYLGVENRNKILTSKGSTWLSVPIASSRKSKIKDAQIHDVDWKTEHSNKIIVSYSNAPYFDKSFLQDYLQSINGNYFADAMISGIHSLCSLFGFIPNTVRSSELDIDHSQTGPQHLYDIFLSVNGTCYISGGNGKSYGIDTVFQAGEIAYHMPVAGAYPQQFGRGFVPWMCFLDTVFNIGFDATKDMIETPLNLT